MIIASLSCLGVLIVSLSVLYGLFGEKINTRSVIICGSLIISLVAFALTILNFTSFASAVAIFFPLALTTVGVSEMIVFTQIEEKNKKLLQAFFFDVGVALFAVGIIVLGEFNFIGLLCGELGGLCLGLLFWAVKKTKSKLEILSSILGYLFVGMLIGGCVWNVVCGTHFISSIITLSGSALILASMILKTFGENNANIRIAQRIVLALALATITFGIYFF